MSNPAAVPKPTNAGSGVNAILQTANAYVNVRTGPGTQYKDIGDLRDNALVVYYPKSRTADQWYWVEQHGMAGWVAGSVAKFENAVVATPTTTPQTPYDGKTAVWHWKGESVAEKTIEEYVANLKRRAPNIKMVFVKTSDGADWMGKFDKSALAINGPTDIARWVQILQQNGLEFHAWAVPTGLYPDAEANLISIAATTPGVQSMLLDVEPYDGFWQVGAAGVRPLMLKVRQRVGGRFHIAMTMDPRPWHYDTIFPQEWLPFINSVHPQVYWKTFRVNVADAMQQMTDTWKAYGKPIIPALQADADITDQVTAHTLATQRYGYRSVSWWRYGVISQWGAVNTPVIVANPGTPSTTPTDGFADEVIIAPGNRNFRSGTYTGRNEFLQFTSLWGWPIYYKATEQTTSKVWAEWRTDIPESGRYEISTFVSARHATTRRTRFKINGVKGTTTEITVQIDQSRSRDVWVPLGIFELVKGVPGAGRVLLNDVTGETGLEIAFDAIRYRRVITVPGGTTPPPNTGGGRPSTVNGIPVSDGYDAPIGTADQRRTSSVWPPGWSDASPFDRLYFVGTPSEAYHTGADLNWGAPYEDKGLPVSSCANGVVTFAGRLPVWGNVIVIRHDPLYLPGGAVLYSRYGHVQNMKVKSGDRVKRGGQVAEVGDAFGRFVPHLHFDLSPTSLLERNPGDWPGKNEALLRQNYIDPLLYIRRSRP